MEYETATEERFTYIDAFLQGFRSNEVIPSAMNCSFNLRDSLLIYNETQIQWANSSNEDYGNTREQVFDTTSWISYNLAPASRYCFMSGLDVVTYVQVKDEQFGGFSEILPAWLQNLLGNVITLNSISKKIDDAKLANDTVASYYWYGRLFNILLVFEPIEVDTFEEGYEENSDDWLMLLKKLSQGFDSDEPTPAIGEDEEPAEEVDLPGNVLTNSFYFGKGFLSTAFGDLSPNSTVCSGNITALINNTMDLKNGIFETENTTVMGESAVEFESVLATVHPITFHCYYAGIEYQQTWDSYMENLGDS